MIWEMAFGQGRAGKPGNPVIQLLTIFKYDIIDKIHQMCLQR
jgi:hypothetical protein